MFANSIVSGVLSLEMRAIAHGGGGDHADHLEGGGRKSARERWVIVTRPEVGLQARAESSSLVCVAARDSELNPAVVADPLACRGRALLADPAQFARTSVSVILGEMDEDELQGAELETVLLYEEEGGGAEPEGGSSQASSSEDSLIGGHLGSSGIERRQWPRVCAAARHTRTPERCLCGGLIWC